MAHGYEGWDILYVVDTLTHRTALIQSITNYPGATDIDWSLSPNGTLLAVTENHGFGYGELALVSFDDHPIRPIHEIAYAISWSPDSRLLYYWSGPAYGEFSALRIYNIELDQGYSIIEQPFCIEGDPNRTMSNTCFYEYAFSPRGDQLALWSGGNIWLVDLHGLPTEFLPLPFHSGWQYQITPSGANLNLRDAPTLDGVTLRKLQPGDSVTLLEGPIEADGYTWWKMRAADGLEGWAVEVAAWYERVE